MSWRRTVHLREHQRTAEFLSRSELDQVLASGLVRVQPMRSEGWYELHPGSRVGAVTLPALRLLIQPKVPLENLFFMLGYGAGLTRWRPDTFPYANDPDLLRVMGWVFDAEVRNALVGGLVRGYEPHAERLPTLRGRINIAAQFHARQHQPYPLECSYDEYTADTELNRVLKAALVRLLRVPDLDGRLAQVLRFRLHSFQEVSTVEYTSSTVPELTFTRLNNYWQAAACLAQLILRSQSIRNAQGSLLGTGFTVDMNDLFERFVAAVVDTVALEAGWRLKRGEDRKLAPRVNITPDLILSRGGRDYAVADVKYKVPEQGWTNPDLYQVLAYCIALGLPAGLLVYAGSASSQTHVVHQAGTHLQVVGLHAGGTREELLRITTDIGRQLVEQAERCAGADSRNSRLRATSRRS